MKKNALIIIIFSLSQLAFAYEPEAIFCPATVTCNYQTGDCNTKDPWVLDAGAAKESFEETKTFDIASIYAIKSGGPYQVECVYKYGNNSSISIYTYSTQLLGGNWTYSGFGKAQANCNTPTNSANCQFMSMYHP